MYGHKFNYFRIKINCTKLKRVLILPLKVIYKHSHIYKLKGSSSNAPRFIQKHFFFSTKFRREKYFFFFCKFINLLLSFLNEIQITSLQIVGTFITFTRIMKIISLHKTVFERKNVCNPIK